MWDVVERAGRPSSDDHVVISVSREQDANVLAERYRYLWPHLEFVVRPSSG